MREYKESYTIPITQQSLQPIKQELTYRSRQQAFSLLIGYTITYLIPAIVFDVLVYYISGYILFPFTEFSAVSIALFRYAQHLIFFTLEDRESMRNIPIIQTPLDNEQSENTDYCMIPNPNGNGCFIPETPINKSQLRDITETSLKTKSLTVNYLESIGISRPNAERLRAELVSRGLFTVESNQRLRLTKDGEKSFKQVSTNS